MQAAYHHAAVALRRATSVVVCGHVRPDGDAIGSNLGLTLALREAGIAAVPTLANRESAPSTYDFLPGFGLFVAVEQLEAPDVFVAVDSPNPDRLGAAEQLMRSAKTVIVVDHHPDAKPYGQISVVDDTAAATGQLIWGLAKTLLQEPSADVALCCYVGLITDTGRFSYDNTSARAFQDAAEMIAVGVDPANTARLVYQNRSKASLEIEACAMSRLTVANDGHVAYAWVTDEDFAQLGVLPEEAESLPDSVRLLRGIDVAFLMRQAGDEVRVNLRAKCGFDVGSVARAFGGGGHRAASGLTFHGTMAELLPQLLALLPGGEAA
ncbi:MAG: bifunctional oligoribonuclease/PAP phosphatase NrnA [Coriobacteriia bacterium]|nr:bifunctional oligoribonuclease/PAP phosphatase NrnA [Coriobacteriia bacterium]